jgi:Protein of unknown function (DUF1653)
VRALTQVKRVEPARKRLRCNAEGTKTPMSDLPPLPNTPLGRYRHYKGGEYEVIGVALHSETLEPLVVYRPLYNHTGWWLRPHAMFFESVTIDGVARARFEWVDDA